MGLFGGLAAVQEVERGERGAVVRVALKGKAVRDGINRLSLQHTRPAWCV